TWRARFDDLYVCCFPKILTTAAPELRSLEKRVFYRYLASIWRRYFDLFRILQFDLVIAPNYSVNGAAGWTQLSLIGEVRRSFSIKAPGNTLSLTQKCRTTMHSSHTWIRDKNFPNSQSLSRLSKMSDDDRDADIDIESDEDDDGDGSAMGGEFATQTLHSAGTANTVLVPPSAPTQCCCT
ncbi:hypothetical protein NP493_293g04008, partial [Ridgeia piscesae]